jgi:uncharacterized membrane protein YsdA (DUF1294 family)
MRSSKLDPAARAFFGAAIFLLVLAALVAIRRIPLFIVWLYLGMSALSFVVYALDKRAARHGAPRTPENTLHLLALVGGWPGAWFAQQLLRHKSAKTSFRIVYYVTVVLNLAALAYLLTDDAAQWIAYFRSLAR